MTVSCGPILLQVKTKTGKGGGGGWVESLILMSWALLAFFLYLS